MIINFLSKIFFKCVDGGSELLVLFPSIINIEIVSIRCLKNLCFSQSELVFGFLVLGCFMIKCFLEFGNNIFMFKRCCGLVADFVDE